MSDEPPVGVLLAGILRRELDALYQALEVPLAKGLQRPPPAQRAVSLSSMRRLR